ncbi:MAG TPA: acetyl-CoA hydrolase/transferase C-terminal domain-containing protein [Planctomycetota bacterium]|nr:acetyl-CoA hydrolase/transferase C-terminal domain-containing protein [Planctomycetota bacterium]
MRRYSEVEACVEDALVKVGREVVLGIPLGLGKPNQIVNEFFRRAAEDPGLKLTIVTALTLTRPRWKGELERRLVEPMGRRLFGGYPELLYATARDSGTLPANVEVREFYFAPGSQLAHPRAQQSYTCSNYTHVVRDALDLGLNVFAQLVSAPDEQGHVSLSCNSDLTLDLLPHLREEQRRGRPVAVLAQVNPELPFMYGDARVEAETFDALVEGPELAFPLFGPPNEAVSGADYMIALHATALVRDGGTIQLGIGALGDAITHLLVMRHERNERYAALLRDSGALDAFGPLIERLGGTGVFAEGLYAATEMLVDGLLDLYRAGVLKREVEGGAVAHAGFFLGPRAFYERLRGMSRADRERFEMTSISFVNQLYGDHAELKRRQRRHARFLNSGMKVTLGGAVASDTLEDGRVLSGIGGQYNFVAMAHALADGRSILMIRSRRDAAGRPESNVVWSHAQISIPRHLRDLVVTEYGIAELRGRSDAEVAAALLNVADSRFQPALLRQAQRAGKLPREHRIPERFRENTPERLERVLAAPRREGLLPTFPQGTDFTPEEVVLGRALRTLLARRRPRSLGVLARTLHPPAAACPYLERMDLHEPRTVRERILRRAVLYALAQAGAI